LRGMIGKHDQKIEEAKFGLKELGMDEEMKIE